MSSKLAKKSIPAESGAEREFILRSEQKVNHFDKYVCYWLFVPFRQDAIITSIADSERPNFPICDQTQDISLTGVGEVGNIRLRRGYHGCVGQLGTTKIPQAFSKIIFCITCNMQLKGGKQ